MSVETSLTDWNRQRHLLTEVHLSVQRGDIVKHLRNISKKPKVAELEFQIVDLDDEFDLINPSDSQLFPIPTGSVSQIKVEGGRATWFKLAPSWLVQHMRH